MKSETVRRETNAAKNCQLKRMTGKVMCFEAKDESEEAVVFKKLWNRCLSANT